MIIGYLDPWGNVLKASGSRVFFGVVVRAGILTLCS